MDPLSLTASILAITTTCLKSAHLLNGLRDKYKHAQMTISALCAEATAISAALSQIQSLILGNPDAVITQLRPRSEVIATFDSALTGCSVVLAVLDDEIAALITEGRSGDMSWDQRVKLVWKDAVMQDLLQQLRGQSAAIGLLIQVLQIESISGIRTLLQQNSFLLDQVMRQTRSLRDTHPKVKAPRSIFNNHLEEIGSVVGTEHTGLSDSTFLFDDLVVDSKVYRRVLAQAKSQMALNEVPPKDEKDVNNLPGTNSSDPPVTNPYGRDLRIFLSSLTDDTAFQKLRETALLDQDFKDELSAIVAWFRVVDADERKILLCSLAKINWEEDCEEKRVTSLFPHHNQQNKRYGWI